MCHCYTYVGQAHTDTPDFIIASNNYRLTEHRDSILCHSYSSCCRWRYLAIYQYQLTLAFAIHIHRTFSVLCLFCGGLDVWHLFTVWRMLLDWMQCCVTHRIGTNTSRECLALLDMQSCLGCHYRSAFCVFFLFWFWHCGFGFVRFLYCCDFFVLSHLSKVTCCWMLLT